MENMIDFSNKIVQMLKQNETIISSVAGLFSILGGLIAILQFLKKIYKKTDSQNDIAMFNSALNYNKFIGCRKIVKNIYCKLRQDKFVWICGMAGTGKSYISTYIAKKYFCRSSIFFEWNNDFLTTLISPVNIIFSNTFKEATDKEFIVRNKLDNIRKKTLVIFDGVDNFTEEDIKNIRSLHQNKKIYIIVTSRITQPSGITMPMLSLKDGMDLFMHYYAKNDGKRNNKKDLSFIIDVGGNHCLTIKILACYARKNRISINELKRQLTRSSRSPLTSLECPVQLDAGSGYEKVIDCLGRLVHISFRTKGIQELASVIASFSDLNIPGEFLRFVYKATTTENLYQLEDEAWVIRSKKDYYRMHSVVAEVVRNVYPLSDVLYNTLAKSMKSYIEYPREVFSTVQNHNYKDIVSAFLLYQERHYFFINAELYYYLGRLENDSGNSLKSIDYLKKAYDEVNGVMQGENTENLIMMIKSEYSEAVWFRGENYLYQAINVEEIVYNESKKKKNEQHLLYSAVQLALYLSETNEKNELIRAENILQNILKIIKVQFNKHGRVAMMFYINYGVVEYKLGKYENARKQFEYCIDCCRIYNMIDNVDFAKVISSCGRVYLTIYETNGQNEFLHGAAVYLKEAIVIKEKIYPYAHPTVAVSYHVYSEVLFKMGDYRQACEYEYKALQIRKCNPDKIEYLASSYYNLANIFYEDERFLIKWWHKKKAKEYYSIAFNLYKKIGKGFEMEISRCKERRLTERHRDKEQKNKRV